MRSQFQLIARGIRHRPGQSTVVVVLAAVAMAAAMASPAYVTVAHQSLLTDGFDFRPAGANGARFETKFNNNGVSAADYTRTYEAIEASVSETPGLGPLRPLARYAQMEIKLDETGYAVQSQLNYRQDLCRELDLVDGVCRTGPDEVLISQRTAELLRFDVGDEIVVGDVENSLPTTTSAKVSGIYEPRDKADPYWGPQEPFKFGGGEPFLVDSLLVTAPQHMADFGETMDLGVDYRTVVPEVRLVSAGELSAGLHAYQKGRSIPGHGDNPDFDVLLRSEIPEVIEAVTVEQDAVSVTVPFVMVPLQLLCWFTLYLVVARLSEERAPQLALAKLRGHRQAALFGLGAGEAATLIVAGLPIGGLLAWGLVETVARFSLAEGASVALSPALAWYAAASLLGCWTAVLAAAVPVLRRPVLALLRRVPRRGPGRVGLAEGVVFTLAAVAVWQVLAGTGTGTVDLVAAPVLALAAGVLAARLLTLWTRRRLPRAARAGRITALLALTQLSRRPQTRRTVTLVTVAVAVVTFGVCAWDVSRHNRELAVSDELGADRVYTLAGGIDSQQLMDTVERLDPGGEHLMAVMRYFNRFDNEDFTTVGVQSQRLSEVARWRGWTQQRLAGFEETLRPDGPEPLRAEGAITVRAEVTRQSGPDVLSLMARIVGADGRPETVGLGPLEPGERTYTGTHPDCADGCRLIGVGVTRHPGPDEAAKAEIEVSGISDSGGPIDADLGDCDRWQPVEAAPEGATVDLGCRDGLTISVSGKESADFLAQYASAPAALPVALAGPSPDSRSADGEFSMPGLGGQPQRYRPAELVPVVPRGGTTGLLVDLDYLNRAGQAHATLSEEENLVLEVWANDTAAPDLDERLAESGLAVASTEYRAEELERLSRQAPAVSLRLYLLAAFIALVLILGVVVLTAVAGAAERSYDVSALAVAGVPPPTLKRAAVLEQLYCLAVPLAAGVLAGIAGLALVLPRTTLVSLTAPPLPPDYSMGLLWPGIGAAAVVSAFGFATWLVVRIGGRTTGARRLREGTS